MCARDAVGLQALTDAVADLLGTAQLDPEAAQLCSARQLAAATRARDALAEAIAARQNGFGLDAAAVCLTDALQALFDLTGENASDATIEEVFETFCVGRRTNQNVTSNRIRSQNEILQINYRCSSNPSHPSDHPNRWSCIPYFYQGVQKTI